MNSIILKVGNRYNSTMTQAQPAAVANPNKLRVAWLCPYPPGPLRPELMTVRRSNSHPASWIVNLAKALAERQGIDLHVVSASSGILKNQTFRKDGITFHVIRHTF